MSTNPRDPKSGTIHYVARLGEILSGAPGQEHEKQFESQGWKWIRKYAEIPSERFAVIKIGGESIVPGKGPSKEFIEAMGILSRLDLYAPVVYGWGGELTRRLSAAGIKTVFDEETGNRITKTEAEMKEVEEIAGEYALLLEECLGENHISARVIPDAFRGSRKYFRDHGTDHYTGQIEEADLEGVTRAIEEGYVPIVWPLAKTSDDVTLNVNADSAAAELAKGLRSSRLVFLTEVGYVRNRASRRIDELLLDDDLDAVFSTYGIEGGMKKKIREMHGALRYLVAQGEHTTGAVASPSNLIVELFTDNGAGTQVTYAPSR